MLLLDFWDWKLVPAGFDWKALPLTRRISTSEIDKLCFRLSARCQSKFDLSVGSLLHFEALFVGNHFAMLEVASQYSQVHCPTVARNTPVFIVPRPAGVVEAHKSDRRAG